MACHSNNSVRRRFHRKARATPIEGECDNDSERWHWRWIVDGSFGRKWWYSVQRTATLFNEEHDDGDGGGSESRSCCSCSCPSCSVQPS